MEFNNALGQIDLIDIYRTFYQQQQNMLSYHEHVEHSPK